MKKKLGFVYFSEILDTFKGVLKTPEYFTLRLLTKNVDLKQNFKQLYNIFQFLEATQNEWEFDYIWSFFS